MKVTFLQPITVGDLEHKITVESMELITIAFNLAPFSGGANAIVSITLRDKTTGFQQHYLYEDDTLTPTYWNNISCANCPCCQKPWPQHLLERLLADGKLPAGTIS